MYCILFKRIQLNCSAWVQFLETREDSRGGNYINPFKNMCLYHCMIFPLVDIIRFFVYNKCAVKCMHSSSHSGHYII